MNNKSHVSLVHVAVGVICDERGRVLITQRSERQHLGGFWEFPGGKVEPGEDVQQTLARELREELGINIVPEFTRPLCVVEHDYGDKKVLLDVWRTSRFQGVPSSLEGQPMRWVTVDDLQADQFPAANRAIIRNIQLPEQIAIVDLSPAPDASLPLLPARDPALPAPLIRLRAAWPALTPQKLPQAQRYDIGTAYLKIAEACLGKLTEHGVTALLDLAPLLDHRAETVLQLATQYPSLRGLHSNRWLLPIHQDSVGQETLTAWLAMLRRHEHLLLGASCHNPEELQAATRMGADFAFLSPVKATPSHPDAVTLGWSRFREHVATTRLPVYALGGMRPEDMTAAQQAGARGIAGVSLFQPGISQPSISQTSTSQTNTSQTSISGTGTFQTDTSKNRSATGHSLT